MTDIPPLPTVPSTKEVVEDLRELILQYMNVEDSTERATRQQRVLQSEQDGTLEAAATNIIQASTTASLASIGVSSPPSDDLSHVADGANVLANPKRKGGRPARSSSSQNNIRFNPKIYAGMVSMKENINRMNHDAKSCIWIHKVGDNHQEIE